MPPNVLFGDARPKARRPDLDAADFAAAFRRAVGGDKDALHNASIDVIDPGSILRNRGAKVFPSMADTVGSLDSVEM